MICKVCWFIIICWANGAFGLLCFNCSSTQRDSWQCAGDFVPSGIAFNNSRELLVNCTEEDAMCFVRSWVARGRFAWVVQRGCYHPTQGDTLPRSMTLPTRAMSCKQERLTDAEYKVCFCRADWCNTTPKQHLKYNLLNIYLGILFHFVNYVFNK